MSDLEENIDIDYYISKIDEVKDIIHAINSKKMNFYLPNSVRNYIYDIFDLLSKLKEIKKKVNVSLNDESITQKETQALLEDFKVIKKIISILIEEQQAYNETIDKIVLLYRKVRAILNKIQFIEDVERRVFSDGYDSIKRKGYSISEKEFFDLVLWINQSFEFGPPSEEENQHYFNILFSELFSLLSEIYLKIPMNTLLVTTPFLISKYIKTGTELYELTDSVNKLKSNNYYISLIEEIVFNLSELEKEFLIHEKTEIKIKNWLGVKKEFQSLVNYMNFL